jgi:nitroimidazol reductase NimA-like FMN-containing flavoprotein (pyridoxamine 5'-phosphate oxidase superfamily)
MKFCAFSQYSFTESSRAGRSNIPEGVAETAHDGVIKMSEKMRRDERSMSACEMEKLLREAPAGRLGTCVDSEPYVVPLNFIYYDGRIFFHCAQKGKKLDCIARNPRVCFEVDEFIGVKDSSEPCSMSTHYRSVIVFGEARIIEATDRKAEILKELVRKYAKRSADVSIGNADLRRVAVVEILVKAMTGKQNLH